MDAKNAFYTINKETMLHKIRMKCPSLAIYVEKTYSDPSVLYISDNSNGSFKVKVLRSMEGTTQGDLAAMAMYALSLSVLQNVTAYDKKHV